MDPSRLNAFYRTQLGAALGGDRPHWAAWSASEPLALAGLLPDPWHSEIYGMSMGKIAPWLDTVDPRTGEALLEAVMRAAAERGYEHLSVRLDGEDFENLHLMERAGFLLVDVSMKFSRPMPWGTVVSEAPGKKWSVREAGPADSDWIVDLGARHHGGTHYLNDPALPVQKTHALFGAWVKRCLEGLAYKIYAIEDPSGQGRGFVIYLQNRGFAEAVGRRPIILDYVILDPDQRGRGLGPWLIEQSLAREGEQGFDYCELRTSQHNHSAVVCYEKLNFRLCATDFVLHRKS